MVDVKPKLNTTFHVITSFFWPTLSLCRKLEIVFCIYFRIIYVKSKKTIRRELGFKLGLTEQEHRVEGLE